SAPSSVTKEFSDMFCALNGATFTPCRASHRHNPATSTLLPASEPVPATSSVPRTDAGYSACPCPPACPDVWRILPGSSSAGKTSYQHGQGGRGHGDRPGQDDGAADVFRLRG